MAVASSGTSVGTAAIKRPHTAGAIMEATKLPLTTCFLTFYLVGQARTGISSLALMRQLGLNYRTAWLIHNKTMHAMCARDEADVLQGKV
jgi:hypothetical protein